MRKNEIQVLNWNTEIHPKIQAPPMSSVKLEFKSEMEHTIQMQNSGLASEERLIT
jgi:hypothetical protein